MATTTNQNPQGGSTWSRLQPKWKTRIKILVAAIILIGGFYGAYELNMIPGFSSSKSKEINKFSADNSGLNSNTEAAKLKVPNVKNMEFAVQDNIKETRLMNYIWFGNAGMIAATGGPVTMKGSLMEQFGVKLHMITNNSNQVMKDQLLSFISAYAKGDKNPTVGVALITVMGDGNVPLFSTMNKNIVKAFGEEYQLKSVGVIGFSMGEDCLMGPQAWLDNPSLMRGAVVSGVIGDGDWGLGVRFLADITDEKGNRIPVNPDPSSYDPNGLNFVPAPNDDFMEAANDVIAGKSAKDLKVKDASGHFTGKTITKKIEGCVTWFPGDLKVVKNTNLVKIISTKQYPNQMGTTIVGCDKWMKENSKVIEGILGATYVAANQIKLYDEWFRYACDVAPSVFYPNSTSPDVSADEWYRFAKPGGTLLANTDGIKVLVGGTQMANLADAKKYYGIGGGNDYYKAVYEYFSGVIKDLNPCDIMGQVGGKLTPYDQVVDATYLQKVNIGGSAGVVEPIDYSKNTGHQFAKKVWHVEFEIGSAKLTSASKEELKTLYESLKNWNEGASCNIIGHTDNTGNADANMDLSLERARSVKTYLIELSGGKFPSARFHTDGKGQTQPVDPNANQNSAQVRKLNRRVEVALTE